jgi:protein-tyrosine phosphatase
MEVLMTITTEPAMEPMRHLQLAGAYNVRDTGGYLTVDGRTIHWHTLLRGDSLHRLTPEAQAHLIGMGLRTVVDLRRSSECAESPNVFADSGRVRYLHLPLFDDAPGAVDPQRTLDWIYRAILDDAQPRVRAIFGALAKPDAFPALVHCTAGKDRTGVIIALLLGVAGVPDEIIVRDYALSEQYLTDDFHADLRTRVEARGSNWAAMQQLLGAPTDVMEDTLSYLSGTYGDIATYLGGIGVTDSEIAAVRAALVVEA